MSSVTAFILAGGKSSRMGRDKAFVPWEGHTLLERALELVGQITPNLRIVGARSKFEKLGEVVEDIYPGRGPLGGIHAALCATSTDLNLVLAVDLPYVTKALLQYLVDQAQNSQALVAVPRLADGWQPLCAVYRKGFATIAESALREGRNAVHSLLESGTPRVFDEAELTQAGFQARMFRNINTTMDLETAVDPAPPR
jgi:molybdopterin-guanine dinucleotide biosynthesis protein A